MKYVSIFYKIKFLTFLPEGVNILVESNMWQKSSGIKMSGKYSTKIPMVVFNGGGGVGGGGG